MFRCSGVQRYSEMFMKKFGDYKLCLESVKNVLQKIFEGYRSKFRNVFRYSWMFTDVHGCSRMFTDVHGCSRMFTDVHGCSWMFTDVHGCLEIFMKKFGDYKLCIEQ
jgi:hypothetical protein